ncbi:MAG: cyclic nucleotide-binding domain-containing protein [Chloroflexi bacterium]|nr:cyclic nucleotide-binding domain-containing protein [Chloroflexota bacterium]
MSEAPALTESVLLRGLEPEQLQKVAAVSRTVEYPPDSTLFKEGDPLEELYIVERGRVKLIMAAVLWEGGSTLLHVVHVIGPYGAFGWSALVEPHRATLSAYTGTGCRLVAIRGAELLGLMEQDPVMGYRVMTALAGLIAQRLEATRRCLAAERATDIVRGPVLRYTRA